MILTSSGKRKLTATTSDAARNIAMKMEEATGPSAEKPVMIIDSVDEDEVIMLDRDDGENEQAVSINCELCTFANLPDACKCAMCGSVFAAAEGEIHGEEGDCESSASINCELCTFANLPDARKCSMCGSVFAAAEQDGGKGEIHRDGEDKGDNKQTESNASLAEEEGGKGHEIPRDGEDKGDNDQAEPNALINCKLCTFANLPDARKCSMCGTVFAAAEQEGGKGEIQHATRTKLTKLALYNMELSEARNCELCTFANLPDAMECSMCGSVFAAMEIECDSQTKLVNCGLCSGELLNVDGHKFGGCGHVCCRGCVAEVIHHGLEKMKVENEFEGINCPECGSSMAREDLRIIGGKKVLDLVDQWVCSRIADASAADLEADIGSIFSTLQELKAVYESGCKKNSSTDSKLDNALTMSEAMAKLSNNIKDLCMKSGNRVSFDATVLLCSDSAIREVLGCLLRNSLLDIHTELYFELFVLMRTILRHPELFPLVCCNTSEPEHDFWSDEALYHPCSLMACLENLHKQATFILHTGGVSDEGPEEMALMSEVKDVFEQLHERITLWRQNLLRHAAWMKDADAFFEAISGPLERNNTPDHQDAKGKAVLSPTEPVPTTQSTEELDYISALKPHQFGQASLLNGHYYRKNLNDDDSTAIYATNSRRIAKELAGLPTQLPLEYHSSIHVRVDEHRLDILRALIIGPADTPYENGIFLFDIHLPLDYPNKPPHVQFLTTAGGRVRFNPNLYECGKVCLSLLGTWNGPGWKPNKSTLLQVLVSLQSLVLVAEPYCNEPGYASQRGKRQSEQYSFNQRFNTLMHSMLPALRNPDEAFKEVIMSHFRCKRRKIEEQCEMWSAMKYPGNAIVNAYSIADAANEAGTGSANVNAYKIADAANEAGSANVNAYSSIDDAANEAGGATRADDHDHHDEVDEVDDPDNDDPYEDDDDYGADEADEAEHDEDDHWAYEADNTNSIADAANEVKMELAKLV